MTHLPLVLRIIQMVGRYFLKRDELLNFNVNLELRILEER